MITSKLKITILAYVTGFCIIGTGVSVEELGFLQRQFVKSLSLNSQ